MKSFILLWTALTLAACATTNRSASADMSIYKPTPFTLALVGKANSPEHGNVPDINNATDLAYCVHLLSRDAFQTRVGSDFSKNALEKRRKLRTQMQKLGVPDKRAEALIRGAAQIETTAINKGRSGDNKAMMAYNFGGHKKSCYAAADEL